MVHNYLIYFLLMIFFFFVEASIEQDHCVSIEQDHCVFHCLDTFCQVFGEKINRNKTCVYFSKNVDTQLREDILHHTGFNQVNSFGLYLWANLAPGRRLRLE